MTEDGLYEEQLVNVLPDIQEEDEEAILAEEAAAEEAEQRRKAAMQQGGSENNQTGNESSLAGSPRKSNGYNKNAARRAQSLNIDAYSVLVGSGSNLKLKKGGMVSLASTLYNTGTGSVEMDTMRRHQSLTQKTVSAHSRNNRIDTSSESDDLEEEVKQPVRRRKSVSLLEEISSSEWVFYLFYLYSDTVHVLFTTFSSLECTS